MALPSTPQDLAELAAQEERLVFDRFDNATAWDLGVALVTAAQAEALPVVVSITRGGQRLFHAALPGTTPDNDDWVERKSRAVLRFGHSSLYLGTQARVKGGAFEDRGDLDHTVYAAHGGSFPVTVRNVGVVGAVTVSGLPQLDDHAFLVGQLTAFLAGAPRLAEDAALDFAAVVLERAVEVRRGGERGRVRVAVPDREVDRLVFGYGRPGPAADAVDPDDARLALQHPRLADGGDQEEAV
jgi:uncharacterized protein (UPF0303 family)